MPKTGKEKLLVHKDEVIENIKEITDALSGNNAHITLVGNRELMVDGCKSIVEYNDDTIKVNIGTYILAVTGRNLQIKYLSTYQLAIAGFITNVAFTN